MAYYVDVRGSRYYWEPSSIRSIPLNFLRFFVQLFFSAISLTFRTFVFPFVTVWNAVNRRIIQPFVYYTQPTATYLNERKWKIVRTVALTGIFAWNAFAVAVITYVFLYNLMVPQLRLDVPLYFHFDDDSTPHADVPINPSFPYNAPSVQYDVEFHMEVPESPQNIQIGMFMVSMEFFGPTIEHRETHISSVYNSSRPAIVHYKSGLLRTLSTFFYSLPLLTGFAEEKQRLDLSLVEGLALPFSKAIVRLSNPYIQLYSASVTFQVKLSGIRYYMYHWFFTSFWVGIFTIFFLELLGGLFFWASLFASDKIERLPPPQRFLYDYPTPSPDEVLFEPIRYSNSYDVPYEVPVQETSLQRNMRLRAELDAREAEEELLRRPRERRSPPIIEEEYDRRQDRRSPQIMKKESDSRQERRSPPIIDEEETDLFPIKRELVDDFGLRRRHVDASVESSPVVRRSPQTVTRRREPESMEFERDDFPELQEIERPRSPRRVHRKKTSTSKDEAIAQTLESQVLEVPDERPSKGEQVALGITPTEVPPSELHRGIKERARAQNIDHKMREFELSEREVGEMRRSGVTPEETNWNESSDRVVQELARQEARGRGSASVVEEEDEEGLYLSPGIYSTPEVQVSAVPQIEPQILERQDLIGLGDLDVKMTVHTDAELFHVLGPVRDGKGWDRLAMVIRL
eukprot:TRINITY_DN2564_c0_g2_i2.p1 TRINITY_DN2564_c0_g2~~TRINITY_DN2564_c0_g2_i2.p1  ORF type:complete len:687 (+),score=127.34 TRINITY_DN2564_c0_g2_i2:87-2147(+)